jgi:hypothetical protein
LKNPVKNLRKGVKIGFPVEDVKSMRRLILSSSEPFWSRNLLAKRNECSLIEVILED